MSRNKGMQLGALIITAMLITMSFVPAVSAAQAVETVTQTETQTICDNGTCPTCGLGNFSNISKLDEEELANDLHIALNSADVKKLKKELESRGYEFRIDNAQGLSVTKADGNSAEGIVLPFSSQDNTEVGMVAEVNTHKVIKAVAILIYKNETKFPVAVEQLSIDYGKVVSEKMDIPSILSSEVSIQYSGCDACRDIYGLACAVGCGVGIAAICVLAGITTIGGGLACAAVASVVCYFIGKYGCEGPSLDFCKKAGYC